MIREKVVLSGPLFEADFFPVFADGRKLPARAPKTKPTCEEQKKYNKKRAEKRLVRLVNANFDDSDIIMHPTYQQDSAKQTEEEVYKDIANYIRRMKYWREKEAQRVRAQLIRQPGDKMLTKKLTKLEEPFRYIYAVEKQVYKTGKKKGMTNWHCHIFMTGAGEGGRDKAEEEWKNGMRSNADRFRPEIFGPEAAARYISKDPQGSKRYRCSKNLKQPKEPPPKDGRIGRSFLAKLAKERVDDKAYWENRYKGYRFISCYPKFNEYNANWYLSVVMYKIDGEVPEWAEEDWNTECY